MALDLDGVVWTWGDDGFGQQGRGGGGGSSLAVPIPGLAGVIAVAAGRDHSLALAGDGTVWAWGANGSGQIGDATTTPRSTPIQVPGLAGIVAVAAGEGHSLAVGGDGAVYAWGANTYGQLGDGTTAGRASPGLVVGVASAVGVAAGQFHSLARAADGSVWAWGANDFGQLGDLSTTQRTLPVQTAMSGAALVAAGRSHSVAVASDGTLWTWGENTAGQLGDGTRTSRATPGAVAGVGAVTGAAGGTGHTAAVTGDGVVWTWGGNGYGQLGDGTLAGHTMPLAVSEAGFVWRTATPTLSPNGGSFASAQAVVISSATPGAVIHYTLTGVEPTEGDAEVANGGSITIDGAVTLKARAWGPSMPPSATATADFMPGVSAPTITPGDGTYTMAQFVLLGVATSGAEIRFTLDGTDPNEGSALYAGPLEVATATVLKARGYKAGFAPSVVTSATFTFDYGTLATPTAYPPAGSYLAAQSVTLSGPPGGTVRYTLDGTEPTALSPAYTAPVTVASTLVLKARAFLTDWAPSATLVAAYTIGAEAVPPSIQVSVLPPANAAGWHQAPVRLVYACSDVGSWVATCPPEAVVATDGAGQTVTAVATDAAGNEATASVTLSIDRTAPVVEMTAPANGQTVTGTDVTVSGTVADALSGLASAQCNGVPAAVVAGTITCTVAVRPGTNAVVLQASDVAGNRASVGVRVLVPSTPTSVAIVPAQPALGVGQTREVRLVDQAGLPVSGATWAVSEATILSVTDTDGVVEVEALAVGSATVSATWNGLTAETVVTVAALTAEGGITPGTKLWTLPLLDPMASRQLFFANRVEAEGPDLFFLETGDTAATLRGVRADGTPLSAWPVPAEATMVLADRDGGVGTERRRGSLVERTEGSCGCLASRRTQCGGTPRRVPSCSSRGRRRTGRSTFTR